MSPLDTPYVNAFNQPHFVRNPFTRMSGNKIQVSLRNKFLILSTTFGYVDVSLISLQSDQETNLTVPLHVTNMQIYCAGNSRSRRMQKIVSLVSLL